MIVLDIDLDFFVRPVARSRSERDPRLPDEDYSVPQPSVVADFLIRQCLLRGDTLGMCLEHHVEVLAKMPDLIAQGRLQPPLTWVHVDAHDDLWGHYSAPANSGNFLYECVRRGWLRELIMVFPPNELDFPSYVFQENPPALKFEGFLVPLDFSNTDDYKATEPPDFVFLTRSPAFTPPKADVLYTFIRSHFRQLPLTNAN